MQIIKFIASLPPIQSAILLDGQGDGGRIKLDIPRSDIKAIMQLQKLAGKRLRIEIKEDIDNQDIELSEINIKRI